MHFISLVIAFLGYVFMFSEKVLTYFQREPKQSNIYSLLFVQESLQFDCHEQKTHSVLHISQSMRKLKDCKRQSNQKSPRINILILSAITHTTKKCTCHVSLYQSLFISNSQF